MQGGTCGTENCDGRGLMNCVWPIRVGWVAGSRWMPIWLTKDDQLRSPLPEPGCQSTHPKVPVSHAGALWKYVLDFVIETWMQQGILGFVKWNYGDLIKLPLKYEVKEWMSNYIPLIYMAIIN